MTSSSSSPSSSLQWDEILAPVGKISLVSLATVFTTAAILRIKKCHNQVQFLKSQHHPSATRDEQKNFITKKISFRNIISKNGHGQNDGVISAEDLITLSIQDFDHFCDVVMMLMETLPTHDYDDHRSDKRDELVYCLELVKHYWTLLGDLHSNNHHHDDDDVDVQKIDPIVKWWLRSTDDTVKKLAPLWEKYQMNGGNCGFALACLIYVVKLEHGIRYTDEDDVDYMLMHLERQLSTHDNPTVNYLWQLYFDARIRTRPKSQLSDERMLRSVFARLNSFVQELHNGYKHRVRQDGKALYFRDLSRSDVVNNGLVFIVEQLLDMFFTIGSGMQYKRPEELHYASTFLLDKCSFLGQRMRAQLACIRAETMHHNLDEAVQYLENTVLRYYPTHHTALSTKLNLLIDLQQFQHDETLLLELQRTIEIATKARIPHTQLANVMFNHWTRKHANDPSSFLHAVESYFFESIPQPPLTEMHFVRYIRELCHLCSDGNVTLEHDRFMPFLEKFRQDIVHEHRHAELLWGIKMVSYYREKASMQFDMGAFEQCATTLDKLLQHVQNSERHLLEDEGSEHASEIHWIEAQRLLCLSCHRQLQKILGSTDRENKWGRFRAIVSDHLGKLALPFDAEYISRDDLLSMSMEEGDKDWDSFLDIVWTMFAEWNKGYTALVIDICRFKEKVHMHAPRLLQSPVARNAFGLVLMYRYIKKPLMMQSIPLDIGDVEMRRVEKMEQILADMDLNDAIQLLETGSLKQQQQQQQQIDEEDADSTNNNRDHGHTEGDYDDIDAIATDLLLEMRREFESELGIGEEEEEEA